MTNEQIESAIEYVLQIATIGNEEEIETIIEALEKQKPKKSEGLQVMGDTKIYKCDCGVFSGGTNRYCSNCGQKLDWE